MILNVKRSNSTWKKLKNNPIRTTSKFNFRLVNKVLCRHSVTVNNLMLRDCSNELSGTLYYLINLFMTRGTISKEWKLAKVIPFFKYGDRTN